MSHQEHKPAAFQPENFPALAEFLPAYLHEDFGEEYGSAEKAFEALLADANGDQIHNVAEEWSELRKAFVHQPLDAFRKALGQLGAAWNPESEEELRQVDAILSQAKA